MYPNLTSSRESRRKFTDSRISRSPTPAPITSFALVSPFPFYAFYRRIIIIIANDRIISLVIQSDVKSVIVVSVNSLYCRRPRPLHLHFFIPFRIDFKFVRFIFQVFEYIYSRIYLGIKIKLLLFGFVIFFGASLIGVDSLEKKNIRLNVEHFLRYRGT